ncbi:MAG: enoyl-CoA hydratase [Firmicutes bacterium HGW-Firmicutes-15]|nr:MAG: enoyl-CoA hydratase [Firmicutes bacterium HGW-Firmicutes-15]
MDYKTISITKEGAVGILTLNRPEILNAINDELISELSIAIDRIAQDEQIRVMILTGGNKVFAAGGDIKAMLEFGPLQAKKFVTPIHKVFNQITEMPKPTIAAICGFALGGGVEMALTCDFRIAADNAKFGFPEINLGIFPAAGGSQRLPRLIGMAKAKELMFTGDTIDAGAALAIGLVNQVVPREELMERAMKLAEKLSSKPPITIKNLKESMHNVFNTDINMGLNMEIEKFCSLFASEDQKEGMGAFIEKRKPDFKGR